MKTDTLAKALEIYSPVMMQIMRAERRDEAASFLMNDMIHLRSSLIALKGRAEYELQKFRSSGGEIVRGDETDVFLLGNSALEKMKRGNTVIKNTMSPADKNEMKQLVSASMSDADIRAYSRWIAYIEQMMGEFQNYDSLGGVIYE